MADLNIPDELSEEQRSRIISEVEGIKYNEMRIAKELDSYEREDFIDKMKDMDTEELIDCWVMYVGEWIHSLHHIELEIEDQWNCLLAGEEREYTIRNRIPPSYIKTR